MKSSPETSSVKEIPDDSEIEFLPIRHYQRDERTLIAEDAGTSREDWSDSEPEENELVDRSGGADQLSLQRDTSIPVNPSPDLESDREEPFTVLEAGTVAESERHLEAKRVDARQASLVRHVSPTPVASGDSHSGVQPTYIVRPGDTLSGIAHRTLGQASLFRKIFESNRDVLESPDDLRPGLTLRIPQLQESTVQTSLTEMESSASDLPVDSQPSEETSQISVSEKAPVLPLNFIPPPKGRRHVVQAGETLESIAVRYYGSPKGVTRLRSENPALTGAARRLQPGTVLRIGGTP
ncbi:LysM peptidoglycan-binding domain-containing protein [Thalassoglobus neptunius]|uniref:LysM peptidoglycan-binding domain-containing protein n=1 Tax=Thalassoglobus neptunius TaxID=1938619 RepID=UPI0018D21F28|nr:LysM peptidoglycan-binding domain-containing protein [Thalassoglobus neptunius]